MGDFKKTNIKIFAKKYDTTTPDVLYWKKFGVSINYIKEFGPVDYVDFSPIEPYNFAVTSSVRVQVYNPITRHLVRNLGRFIKNAYGGSYRSDGRLLCAGGEENIVKLFDESTKSLLRVFEGHTGAVHRCFFMSDNTHIASFSDDKSIILWDIPTESKLLSYNEHTDYVRAGAVSPILPDIILSGGYDNKVKLYDTRSQSVVCSIDHGAPVESVLFLSNGSIFLSAGGTEIKVWDALSGGRLLTSMHNHHKTVTCLRLASNGKRILSAGLDRHVNVYDVGTFQKLHAIDYPNGILSMAISGNNENLAVGMVDGLVAISKREEEVKKSKSKEENKRIKYSNASDVLIKMTEYKISKVDRHLKNFDHTSALKSVLLPVNLNTKPHLIVSVLQELLMRQRLHVAVEGNDKKTIIPLLKFLTKHIGDYRFTKVLIDVSNVVLDVYEEKISECDSEAVELFKKLAKQLQDEIDITESLVTIQGCVDLMISASSAGNISTNKSLPSLKPSENVKKQIVNVS